MNLFLRVVILLVLTQSKSGLAQVIKPEAREGMFTTSSDMSGPLPLFELPTKIPSKPGEATCHADVLGISDGLIPIYLINRSAATISIFFVGSDSGLKAHRRLDNGKWERVQPINGWVECADSLRNKDIPPGMFFRISVVCPSSGSPATMRYECDKWVSNEFPGFYDPAARDQAQRDLHSKADCPAWASILKSPLGATNDPRRWGYNEYDTKLSPDQRFAWRAAAIDLLQQYADFHAARLACDDALASIRSLPMPMAQIASARFSLLRSRPSVAVATDLEFASHCLKYLRTIPEDADYGHPSKYPGMCWEALAWLAVNSSESATMPWNVVFSLWQEHLPKATTAELMGMAKLVENALLANEHIPAEILISLLKSELPAMRENAIKRLLERNLDQQLSDAAAELDDAGKSIIIRLVAADQNRFTRRYGPLNDFLVRCAKANPETTFEAIDKSTPWNERVYLAPELSLAFGDFFVKLVSVGLDGPVWLEDSRRVEQIRRGMRYIDRVALLKKLANSQAYLAQKADSPATERQYIVAQEAQRQSMRLGYTP